MIQEVKPSAPRRSRGLIVLTGLLAITQAGAVVHVFQIPVDLAARISLLLPLELAVSAVWALASALVLAELIRRTQQGRRHAIWLLSGFALYSLARLVVFARADYDRQRLPFLLMVVVSVLALTIVVNQKYPRRIEDGRKSQN